LTTTREQDEYINDNRYFIVITLRNNEELLHHALYELLHVISRLGPRHVFVSVFENNSRDKTPQFLALYTDILKLAGVPHNLVSTFTLRRELAALEKKKAETAAAGVGQGRRLLEDKLKGQMNSVEASWFAAAVEGELLQQSDGNIGPTTWWPSGEDEGSQANEEGLRAAFAALGKWAQKPRPPPISPSNLTLNSPLGGGGRALLETAPAEAPGGGAEEASDIAILTEGKWTGNRIEFLARVRNRSIRPLFGLKEKYDKLVIMNDAIFCAEDVIRLALHE